MDDSLAMRMDAMLNALEGSGKPLPATVLQERFSEHRGQPADLALTEEVLAQLRQLDLLQVVEQPDGVLLYGSLQRKSRDGRWIGADDFARFDWSTLRPGDFIEDVGAVSSPSRCNLLRAAMGAFLLDALAELAGNNLVEREDFRPRY